MGHVDAILRRKGGQVVSIDAGASALDAVRAMVDANVGAILVTNGDLIAGIISERDYLRRIAAGQTSLDETPVTEVMSTPVVFVRPDTPIEECMAVMTERRIRHLPVMDGESLAGVISIGDLVKYQSQEQSFQIRYLTEYISAR